jgi:AAA+ superfamily predicted ATPase
MAARPAAVADIVPVAGQPLPYTSSEEHLWDHFARIDQLIRAQTVRWRQTIGESKPPNLWGMVHVTEAEIDGFLAAPYTSPGALPEELEASLVPYWEKAQELEDSIKARQSRTPPETVLRLDWIERVFGLSDLERDILIVVLIPEVDQRYRRLYGYLQDDASRTLPTVELVLQILHPAARAPDLGRSAFGESATLRAHRLIVLGRGQEDEQLPARTIRVDERLAVFLLGRDEPDARVQKVMGEARESRSWGDLSAEPQQVGRLQAIASWWEKGRAKGLAGATLFFHGPYGSGRLAAASVLCAETGTPLLVIDAERALRNSGGWEEIVDLSFREAQLRAAAIYWSKCEALLARDETAHHWVYLVSAAERFSGLCFLAGTASWEPAGGFRSRRFLRLEFPAPSYPLREHIWGRHLEQVEAFVDPTADLRALATSLANGFQLTEGQIRDAIGTATSLAARREPEAPRLTPADLYEGCRRQSGRRLVTMARRVEPRTQLTFDDLVLPPMNRRQVEELRARIRQRAQVYSGLGFERRLSLGKGMIVLFTGSSGTGKTMTAELLAREQGVDMYKVDLAAIVSKWVGETEKNLNQLFAEAEDANAIIFFDEADALFGKRGEVKGAQDRWANIEVNFLLQRVEEYSGVVILATNLSQNIDEAFMRRIHVMVEFPAPDAEARFRIWRGMFPAGTQPPPDEELRGLAAQVKLPGGSIRNIVVDAAFRALAGSSAECGIGLRHLVLATAREYQKLGKPITMGDFGQTFYSWLEQELL